MIQADQSRAEQDAADDIREPMHTADQPGCHHKQGEGGNGCQNQVPQGAAPDAAAQLQRAYL
jgi:hypothetical protein